MKRLIGMVEEKNKHFNYVQRGESAGLVVSGSGKIIIDEDAQNEAKDSTIICGSDIEIGKDAQFRARNSRISGQDIKISKGAQFGARDSFISANNIEIAGGGFETQYNAKNCFIIADRLTVRKSRLGIARLAKGGLIAARELNAKIGHDNYTTILTQSEIDGEEGIVKYCGNFEELVDFLKREYEAPGLGRLAPLALFRIEKKEIKGLEEFEGCLEELGKYWTPKIQDASRWDEELWPLTNTEKYHCLNYLSKRMG